MSRLFYELLADDRGSITSGVAFATGISLAPFISISDEF